MAGRSRLNNQISEFISSRSEEQHYDYFAQAEERRLRSFKQYEDFRRKYSAETMELELKKQMEMYAQGSAERMQLEEKYKALVEENNKRAQAAVLKFEEIRYQRASDLDKKRLNDDKIARLQAVRDEADIRIEAIEKLMRAEGRSDDEIKAAISEESEIRLKAQAELTAAKKQSYDIENKLQSDLIKKAKAWNKDERQQAKAAIKQQYDENIKRLEEIKKKKAEGGLTPEESAELDDEIAQLEAANKAAKGAMRKSGAIDYVQGALGDALNKIGENLTKGLSDIDASIDSFYAAQGSIEARLQGSGESYKQMTKLVSQSIGLSGYISQKKVLENIKTLVEEGISYNVEQRAFLATISENIASTFEAANGTLLRLIRLQQADSTQARLGMEASLTNFLNRMYTDTSYLNDLYDNVSAAIIDANSQLTYTQSVAFEYAIQKWLGSLSSLGMSGEAITNIATGINYLATGNTSALSSNQGLNTLLAMSASRAGISYASMLTGGLTAQDTNDLLRSMVEYLQEIAGNQNKVVKSAYAGMYGLSLADLRAISSLTGSEISAIYGSNMSYTGAVSELNYQMGQISNRVHMSTVLQTIYDNYIGSVASDIGSSPGKYLTWMIADLLESTVGGIPLPVVSVLGSSVDLKSSVAQLMKLGLVGYSTISQLGSLISSATSGPSFALNNFGFEQTTLRSRGQGFVGVAKGAARTDSLSYTGSGMEESDVESLTKASTEKAKESVKSDEEEKGSVKDIWEALMSVIDSDSDKSVRVTVVNDNLPVSVSNFEDMSFASHFGMSD